MKIELSPGDKIRVTLEGTDGEFTIHFGKHDLKVRADLPDSDGRHDVIYHERFGRDLKRAPKGGVVEAQPLFALGDAVRTKIEGGPVMKVVALRDSCRRVVCVWGPKDAEAAVFSNESLVMVEGAVER